MATAKTAKTVTMTLPAKMTWTKIHDDVWRSDMGYSIFRTSRGLMASDREGLLLGHTMRSGDYITYPETDFKLMEKELNRINKLCSKSYKEELTSGFKGHKPIGGLCFREGDEYCVIVKMADRGLINSYYFDGLEDALTYVTALNL